MIKCYTIKEKRHRENEIEQEREFVFVVGLLIYCTQYQYTIFILEENAYRSVMVSQVFLRVILKE